MITNSGTADGIILTVHDQWGNIIAEVSAPTGATVREYIYLPEAEIAPTRAVAGGQPERDQGFSRTTVDRPIAVVSNVNTTPSLLMVHVDHLNRHVKMTNSSGTIVWNAVWQPWGGAHTLSGAEALNARFPGQWFQLEAGLHYNWHRHYDPSLGRYTQPDPLGFVDGPSVYAYAGGNSITYVDKDGRWINLVIGAGFGFGMDIAMQLVENGGRLKCVKLGQALGAGALGAIGGGLGGAGLTRFLGNLGMKQKGRIGEALSLFEHRLRGSKLLDTQVWSRQYRTYYDGVWRSRTGRIYFTESKFGLAQLRPGQRAAQRGLGEDYVVDRWDYLFFGRVGAYPGGLGGALATPSNCGC